MIPKELFACSRQQILQDYAGATASTPGSLFGHADGEKASSKWIGNIVGWMREVVSSEASRTYLKNLANGQLAKAAAEGAAVGAVIAVPLPLVGPALGASVGAMVSTAIYVAKEIKKK